MKTNKYFIINILDDSRKIIGECRAVMELPKKKVELMTPAVATAKLPDDIKWERITLDELKELVKNK